MVSEDSRLEKGLVGVVENCEICDGTANDCSSKSGV